MTIRIEIPHTPAGVLSPNRRDYERDKHGMPRSDMTKYEAKRLLRRSAYLATKSAMNAKPRQLPAGRLFLELYVYWERNRYTGRGRGMPDDDNLIASLKGLLDGVADGLGVNDRRFKLKGIEQDSDPDGAGRVVVLITPEES